MTYKGSKTRVMKYLNKIFNLIKEENNITEFYDLFAGGMNVSSKVNFDKVIANDFDKILIELFRKTRDEPDVIRALETPSKEYYYDVRDNDRHEPWLKGAVLFLGSFNARAYGGCYGAKNKAGTRMYFQERKRSLLNTDLSNIELHNRDYREFEEIINKDSNNIIYLDPPYKATTGYKEEFNHEEFWRFAREQSKNNVVLISELSAPDDFVAVWMKDVAHGQGEQKHDLIKSEKLFIHESRIKEIKYLSEMEM